MQEPEFTTNGHYLESPGRGFATQRLRVDKALATLANGTIDDVPASHIRLPSAPKAPIEFELVLNDTRFISQHTRYSGRLRLLPSATDDQRDGS